MMLCVEHRDPPDHDRGTIVAADDHGSILAATSWSNPLSGVDDFACTGPGSTSVTWSGTLADGLFLAHPPNWLGPGHEAFNAFCDQVAPRLDQDNRTLCICPHSRHILNDGPSALRFLDDRSGGPFAIAVSPAALIEPNMLDRLDDHLERCFDWLVPRSSMLLLADIDGSPTDDACRAVPLGRGRLRPEFLARLIERYVPPDLPIVLMPPDLDAQRTWLEAVVGAPIADSASPDLS